LHERQFKEFLVNLNIAHEPEESIMSVLRALPTSDIKRASETIWYRYDPSLRWPFQPTIDGPGGIIELPPIEALKAGKFHKVPILTGYNTNEGAMFTPTHIATSKEFIDFFRRLLPGLLESDLEKLDLLYPDPVEFPTSEYKEMRKGLGAQFMRLEQAYGQFAYVAPVKQMAHVARSYAPVYLYHFAASTSIRGGADHGTHNPFVTFNEEIRERSEKLRRISGAMHAYWTSFIITGNPNTIKAVSRPTWPEFDDSDGKNGKLVVFGEGNDELAGGKEGGAIVRVTESIYRKEECKFWWERTEKFEL
jgi:acetylcholinesterase